MTHFKIYKFIEENLPDFNPENEQDIIKAEKLLKAESKLNNSFTINEIEVYISELKNPSTHFKEILNISVINNIFSGKNIDDIVHLKPDLSKIKNEDLEIFKENFTTKAKEFLSEKIRKNRWQNLIYFQKYYSDFLSADALDFYKNILHDKNQIIIEKIENSSILNNIIHNYPFAIDRKYYELQSTIDSFEFDDDILKINNSIARNQKTHINNKIVLGKILIAINYFRSEDDTTKNVIKENQKIAKDWVNVKRGFFTNIIYHIVNFFNPDSSKKKLVFAVSILVWLVFLSVIIYFAYVDYKLAIAIITSTLLLVLIGNNIHKSYYENKKHANTEEIVIKFTGSFLIYVVQRILWFIFVPSVLLYVYESLKIGKFPLAFFIIVGSIIYQLYKKYKN